MTRSTMFLALFSAACVPTIPELEDDKSPGPDASAELPDDGYEAELDSGVAELEEEEPAPEPDLEPEPERDAEEEPAEEPVEEPAEEPEPEPEPAAGIELFTGEWAIRGFRLNEDPCGFLPVMQDFPDGVFDLLPTAFDVEGEPGEFHIEATRFGGDFGTEAPVLCTIDGADFTCAPQLVTPVDGLLGSYGWRYVVRYSGTVEGRFMLRGVAEVEFLSVDPATAEVLTSLGVESPLQCTQVMDLNLAVGDATRWRGTGGH